MTDRRKQSIRVAVAGGKPGDERDPIQGLIRDAQEQTATVPALQAIVRDGLESGISDKTPADVWAEAEQRYRARHG